MKLFTWIFLRRRMDNLTVKQRNKNMRHIRSEGTIPERKIMDELKKRKIYFAAYVKKLEGKPDIVFRRKKVVVFIDSDFWHGHTKRFIMPETNKEYWEKKIFRNRQRDKQVNKILRGSGWKVIRIWDYDVKHRIEKCLNIILKAIDKLS